MKQQFKPRYAPNTKPNIKRYRIIKRFKKLTFCLLIGTTITFSGLTYLNYRKSLNWSQNKNGLKMAQMSPDMLQDSPRQIAIKEDFIKRTNQILASDGRINTNKHELAILKKDLAVIKTAKPHYQKKYQQIIDKYQIHQQLMQLFYKNNVKTKLIDVRKTILTIGPQLDTMHEKNPHDKFVDDQMHIIHNLNHDLRIINNITTNVNQLLTINKESGTFKPSVIYANYAQTTKDKHDLIYHWEALNNFNSLQAKIKAILNAQANKIQIYRDYQQDMRNKEQAYDELRKERMNHKADNDRVIEQERQAKLEKERQKQADEEAKRHQEEAEKRQKEQENQSNSDSASNDNDDNSNDNNRDVHTNNDNSSKSKAKPEKDKSNKNSKKKPPINKPNTDTDSESPKDHFIDPNNDLTNNGD